MDVQKIGAFLAQLRKEKNWTQEQLGQALGVTNKTISRWENGNYMPPAEMLLALSECYGISINELLSAQRLDATQYKEKAEENIKFALESSFSLQEKIDFLRHKWKKEHRAEDVLACFSIIGVYLALYRLDSILQFVALILPCIYCAVRNNRMMAYVESHAFDGSGNH